MKIKLGTLRKIIREIVESEVVRDERAETYIQEKLRDFIAAGGESMLAGNVVDMIRKSMEKRLLDKPISSEVYKGMPLKESELREMLGIDDEEPLEDTGSGPARRVGARGGYLWTSDLDVAKKMASTYHDESFDNDDLWSVVLVADTESNRGLFVDLQKFYDNQSFGMKESGVAALGEATISEIMWKKINR